MLSDYNLSWTEFMSKEQLIEKLDQATIEFEMWKAKYNEMREEARKYERLYHNWMERVWEKNRNREP